MVARDDHPAVEPRPRQGDWTAQRIIVLALAAAGAAVTIVATATHWPSSPESPVQQVILVHALIIAISCAVILLDTGARPNRWTEWTPWFAWGALLAGTAAGPLLLAPWLITATVLFAIAAMVAGVGDLRAILRRFAFVLVVAFVNFGLLWHLTVTETVGADPSEFRSLDLRVHSVLADVPLHDVWAFDLPGAAERPDLNKLWRAVVNQPPAELTSITAGLLGLRIWGGDVLNLDATHHITSLDPHPSRLTAADRSLSLDSPGATHGLLRTVYRSENEMVAGVSNSIGQIFFCAALVPVEDGYRMYWATYVKETSRLTPVYMTLIDPFRRQIIYPAMAKNVERAWSIHHEEGAADPAQRTPPAMSDDPRH